MVWCRPSCVVCGVVPPSAGVLPPCSLVCCFAALLVSSIAGVWRRLLHRSCWYCAVPCCSMLFGAVLRLVAMHCVWCCAPLGWCLPVLLSSAVLCLVLLCCLCCLVLSRVVVWCGAFYRDVWCRGALCSLVWRCAMLCCTFCIVMSCCESAPSPPPGCCSCCRALFCVLLCCAMVHCVHGDMPRCGCVLASCCSVWWCCVLFLVCRTLVHCCVPCYVLWCYVVRSCAALFGAPQCCVAPCRAVLCHGLCCVMLCCSIRCWCPCLAA